MTLRPSRRAVLSAAAVLLTGCSEVPSQGPVKRADDPRAAAREGIDVAPHPPAERIHRPRGGRVPAGDGERA
nr:hypothetical protein [Cutibacterium acnes]